MLRWREPSRLWLLEARGLWLLEARGLWLLEASILWLLQELLLLLLLLGLRRVASRLRLKVASRISGVLLLHWSLSEPRLLCAKLRLPVGLLLLTILWLTRASGATSAEVGVRAGKHCVDSNRFQW